jgi:hypothetical protein
MRQIIKTTVTARYVSNSQVAMSLQIFCGPNFGLFSLALNTTVTAPPTAITTPKKSLHRNISFMKNGAMMQFEMMATTPSGETILAGAKP